MSRRKRRRLTKTINRNYNLTGLAVLLLLLTGFFIYSPQADQTEILVEPTDLPAYPFVPDIPLADLIKAYNQKKFKVLVVAGHDNIHYGAEFNSLKEANINLELAWQLENFLRQDEHFQVVVSRDRVSGEYIPALVEHVERERLAIESFKADLKAKFEAFTASGAVALLTDGVHHNFARPEVALWLYGINHWANQNGIDLSLSVHFNDYAGRSWGRAGKYSGFSIYVPESQYSNSMPSKALAGLMAQELRRVSPASDLPAESQTVIEDQELIATGSNNSQAYPSVLTEFAYIYEPQFQAPEVRAALVKELAWLTYRGLKRFFEPEAVAELDDTTLLPYAFTAELREGMRGQVSILALQKLLQRAGFYSLGNECPMNGSFGPCTKRAVSAFQAQAGLAATGYVGVETLVKLNEPAVNY